MTNPDALAALRQYVLTGYIDIDADLLRAAGFLERETEQLLAANTVRELMNHYRFDEQLTIENAERLLAEFRDECDRLHREMMRGGETG